jgi:hypothetical protein
MKTTTRQKLIATSLVGAAIVLTALPVLAEEGGSGHYLPGSISSFVDGTPTVPTFVTRLNGLYYDGSFGMHPTPVAGVSAVNVEATSYATGLTLLWRPPVEIAPNLSYAASATIPYIWLEVTGTVTAGPRTGKRSDRVDGIGDIVVMPLMLNYEFSKDLHADFRFGVYAPTGDYEVGRLANTGKNFWTYEPTFGLLYFGQENGIEASGFVGMEFNTENKDTDYKSGSQLHFDGTLAQHFPLAGGFGGVGVSGYWYEQVTGDSGSGATFGDFKGKTIGVGPVLSYVKKLGKVDTVCELKWLNEFETRNRLEGDYIWLKVVFKF